MKIRNDFVTNSSSSSFVIAFKPFKFDEETNRKYPFLQPLYDMAIEFIKSDAGDYETSGGIIASDIDELDECFIEHYGWHEDSLEEILEENCLHDTYDICRAKLNNGYKILFKDIAYADSALVDFLRELDRSDFDLCIIDGED